MIRKLMEEKRIEIFFQPIISIKNKKIFAFESLTRAYDENNILIPPMLLFKEAAKENLSIELDCYVRELALVKFLNYYEENKEILLFLNFESSYIESLQYSTFLSTVKKYNINTSNLVLEIKEDEIKNNDSILNFVNLYRKNGFIIAIDDFGTGYSSFDRLSLIKPDVVKIDRSLISNVNKNFINSEILTAVSNMCNKIGALVLAEGVEEKNEILNCMEKDIDIFQGFYFFKPKKNPNIILNGISQNVIETIGKDYKQNISNTIKYKKSILKKSQDISTKIVNIFNQNDIVVFEKLKSLITTHNILEAIYTIDFNSGLQKNDTFITIKENTLFNSTKDGHDHNLKEYFFIVKNSSRYDYLSEAYISKASGNLCRTYSTIIEIQGMKYILCLDIKTI